MGNKLNILILGALFAFVSNYGQAQYSLGGGFGTFHGLNTDVNRAGLNAFVEIPASSDASLFVRASFMFPEKNEGVAFIEAKDFNTSPTLLETDVVAKTSYFAIDGGRRSYFINDYDVGLSVFAGPHLKGILASYSFDYRTPGNINPNDYQTIPTSSGQLPQSLDNLSPQYSLLFAFGGTIGVKYQLPYRGALMFDFGLEIITGLYDPSNILGQEISPLSFSFNFGYRFDWY